MKCTYINMEWNNNIVFELVSIRKPGFRLLSEFAGRREQLLTNRTPIKIMLVGMVLT